VLYVPSDAEKCGDIPRLKNSLEIFISCKKVGYLLVIKESQEHK